ncbi:hypothetical protein F4779DRAFT_572343 [Xylariaceae sp. FL0662B]|nr:hypothetical protein F4779DRAFT_572343 [Xylariaceae sp. FL0662B]
MAGPAILWGILASEPNMATPGAVIGQENANWSWAAVDSDGDDQAAQAESVVGDEADAATVIDEGPDLRWEAGSDASTAVDAPSPVRNHAVVVDMNYPEEEVFANAGLPVGPAELDVIVNMTDMDFMAINAGYFHYAVPIGYEGRGLLVTLVIEGTSIQVHLGHLRACAPLYEMFVEGIFQGRIIPRHHTFYVPDGPENSIAAWIILLLGIYGTEDFDVGQGAYNTVHFVQAMLIAHKWEAEGWLRDTLTCYMKNHCARLAADSDVYDPVVAGSQAELLKEIQNAYLLYVHLPDAAKPFPESAFGVLAYRCVYTAFLFNSLVDLHPAFYHQVVIACVQRAANSPWGPEDEEIFTID